MALPSNLKRVNELALVSHRCFSSVAVCASTHGPPPLLRRDYCDDMKPVRCKVAIVTGGCRGIGYHISESLLKAGARAVILGDVLVDELEEATCKLNQKYGENKALFQPCDVTKKEEMEKMFQCTKDKFGKVDIVVNNAGTAQSEWDKMININVTGLVLGTLLGFQHMGTHCGGKGGHIINVASILGLQPLYSMPVYTGTKWFVVGFTKSMGSEYFNNLTNVKVMAVCPGVTDTEIIKTAGQATLPNFDQLGKEAAKSLGSMPPQGPEEVGRSVIEMLQAGENGSVWVSEGCETYKTVMPDRSTFKPPPPCGSKKKSNEKKASKCEEKSDDKKACCKSEEKSDEKKACSKKEEKSNEKRASIKSGDELCPDKHKGDKKKKNNKSKGSKKENCKKVHEHNDDCDK